MATSEYLHDADCFKSYTALREMIFNHQKLQMKHPTHVQHLTLKSSKSKRAHSTIADYRADRSVMIAIQNDIRFINIIMNCRKQKSPIAYVFIEKNLYISCLIKNANGYPIIFVRIPIDNNYTYAIPTESVFELPVQNLLGKDTKFSKNCAYTILFKNTGQNIDFVYEVHTGEARPNITTVNSIRVHNMDAINSLLKSDRFGPLPSTSTDMRFFTQSIEKRPHIDMTTNYMLAFFNMNVLMLREVVDVSSVIQITKQMAKTDYYFRVADGMLSHVSMTNKNVNEKYIASRDDSIIWTMDGETFEGKEFMMMPFETLFKTNYNKSITSSDKIYYAFMSYVDDYMFAKIITPLVVTVTDEGRTYQKLFTREYQIMECYRCVKRDDK